MYLFLGGGLHQGEGGAGDDQPLAGIDEVGVLDAVGLDQSFDGRFLAAGNSRQGVIQLDDVHSVGFLSWGSGVDGRCENQSDKKRSNNEFQ
jgi:hypothetical protein